MARGKIRFLSCKLYRYSPKRVAVFLGAIAIIVVKTLRTWSVVALTLILGNFSEHEPDRFYVCSLSIVLCFRPLLMENLTGCNLCG